MADPPTSPKSAPSDRMSLSRWLIFLLELLIASLLLVAPRLNEANLVVDVFMGGVAISAILALRRTRFNLIGVAVGFGCFLLWVASPFFQIVRALVYFYWPSDFKNSLQPIPGQPDPLLPVMLSMAILSGLVLLLIFLPYNALASMAVTVLLVGLGFVAYRLQIDGFLIPRWFFKTFKAAFPQDMTEIKAISRWKAAAELALVLAVTLFFTRNYFATSSDLHFSGGEAEWLTSSVYAAHEGLQREGRIPLWQPYFESGEPLVENPFAFLFNPFSSLPGLILDPAVGVKISIVLAGILASAGGWFLARMLGLATSGRLLLALLLLGKANMFAMISTGYFQLAVSQAYFPWVIGGTLAILRFPQKRWPVILTALSITLLYFAGNLWYVLPTVVGAVVLALVYIFRGENGRFNRYAARRFLWTILLVAGLSAVTLIPLAINFNRIGRHPAEVEAGWVIPLWSQAVPLYTTSDPYFMLNVYHPETKKHETINLDSYKEFYDSFTVPLWYLGLILVAIPLYRPSSGKARRVWGIAVVLLILATLWGAGGQPLFIWLYTHVSLLGQWHFVGRAFAVGAFWLAVLIAMRADTLWSVIIMTRWDRLGMKPRLSRVYPAVLILALALGSAKAIWDVNSAWLGNFLHPLEPTINRCVTWLRQTHPDQALDMWEGSYFNMTTDLNNHVRDWKIPANFEMTPLASTLGRPDLNLTQALPEFGLALNASERRFLASEGYKRMPQSPLALNWDNGSCLYQQPDALPYAYTVPLPVIQGFRKSAESYTQKDFPAGTVKPVTTVARNNDQIGVVLDSVRNYQIVLTLRERAYPGWRVEVNGQPATLESVGGQIGVVLPPGNTPITVYFEYRPPLLTLGGIITLLTSLFCISYLLFPLRWTRS